MALLSSDSDENNAPDMVLPIDPDRPPTSKKDLLKIQNQLKSKAKKYHFHSLMLILCD